MFVVLSKEPEFLYEMLQWRERYGYVQSWRIEANGALFTTREATQKWIHKNHQADIKFAIKEVV